MVTPTDGEKKSRPKLRLVDALKKDGDSITFTMLFDTPRTGTTDDRTWWAYAVKADDGEEHTVFFTENMVEQTQKIGLRRGSRFTITVHFERNEQGQPYSVYTIALAEPPAKPSVPVESKTPQPPVPTDEHAPPVPLSNGASSPRLQFSDVVNLLHASYVAAGWILREEDAFDATDEVRQALTATLFIGCQKAGITLTKEQSKQAIAHYSQMVESKT